MPVSWSWQCAVIWILFAHWFGDFFCQSNDMAIKKSGSLFWLSMHALAYTAVLTVLSRNWRFALFNGCCHWVIDYFTSKINRHYWNKQDYHTFFVFVGLDQWAHMAILVSTLYWWQ